LLALTAAIYFRPSVVFEGRELVGLDFAQLHIRHMAFAREALFGSQHFLPAWYPRELFGAPFSANLQSFPWIPTRLVLLLFDPDIAFSIGIWIAAALAALFSYLYCRRMGLSEIGAVSAAWTFACSGFFCSRVLAGHLPLLEAYPALPLLLWLGERAIGRGQTRARSRDLAALAIATACVAVAGHPQLPIYAIASAMLYVLIRGHGLRRWSAIGAMILGAGLTLAAWWPMWLLIGRSSRVLALAPATNDIAMPYGRLLALLRPGIDGWPDVTSAGEKNPFHGYPHDGYFWDTASYLGLLPLAAILLLLIWSLVKKRLPQWPWIFFVALGCGAFFFSLPVADPLRHIVPGTFLRSPARLLYLTTFCESVLLGFAVDTALRALQARWGLAVVTVCLAGHFLDLGNFDRKFVETEPRHESQSASFEQSIAREADDGRVASEDTTFRDRYDDVGIFDSILLANPYRAFVGLAGYPKNFNEQRLDGSDLSLAALQATAVRVVITSGGRTDLPQIAESNDYNLYRVPNSRSRSHFYSHDKVDFVADPLAAFVANPSGDHLRLALDAQPAASAALGPAGAIVYSRPSSDEIHLEASADASGFVYVIESDDPGWSATIDGHPARIELANGFAMAVAVPAGKHVVDLHYRTTGSRLGWALSLASLALLAALLWFAR
jgi:hypothetical protein